VKRFITISKELTKLRCSWSWQLSSWDVIKNCLNYSRQRKHCKCEHFFSTEKNAKIFSVTVHVLLSNYCKNGDSFVIWTCGKLANSDLEW